MAKLPSVSRSRGIQEQHIRRLLTRAGYRDVLVNAGRKKELVPRKESPKAVQQPRAKPLVKSPIRAITLPPRDVTIKPRTEDESLKSLYELYAAKVPFEILWFQQSPFGGQMFVELPVCPICRAKNPGNFLLAKTGAPGRFPGSPVVGVACFDCWKKYLREGIMLIEFGPDRATGNISVIKESAFTKTFVKIHPRILEVRSAKMPPELYKKMFPPKAEDPAEKSLKQLIAEMREAEGESQRLSDKLMKDLKRFMPEKAGELVKLESEFQKSSRHLRRQLEDLEDGEEGTGSKPK